MTYAGNVTRIATIALVYCIFRYVSWVRSLFRWETYLDWTFLIYPRVGAWKLTETRKLMTVYNGYQVTGGRHVWMIPSGFVSQVRNNHKECVSWGSRVVILLRVIKPILGQASGSTKPRIGILTPFPVGINGVITEIRVPDTPAGEYFCCGSSASPILPVSRHTFMPGYSLWSTG